MRKKINIVMTPILAEYANGSFAGRTVQSVMDDHYDGSEELPEEIEKELRRLAGRPGPNWDNVLV